MSTYKNLMTVCAVAALALGLAACGGGGSSSTSGGPPAPPAGPSVADLETAADTALKAAKTAVDAVMDDSDDDVVTAADDAVAKARTAVMAASGSDMYAALNRRLGELEGSLRTAKDSRTAAMDDKDAADMKAMMATAAKLYGGIGTTPFGTDAVTKSAAYSGTNDADITVTNGTSADTQVLKATTMTVAANHGWEGKQYTASGTGVDGTYEARVYSDVGAATMGKKFGNAEPGTTYQYELTDGMYTVDATATGDDLTAPRVGGSGFGHTAGVKLFKLPSPNPSGATKVTVSGSFHGVSGTYTCTPGTGATCAAEKAAKGYTLGTTDSANAFTASATAWVFRPSNPEARVTETKDTDYASYGWWLHKGADGMWTASAFVDDKGTAPAAIDISGLQGTATYMGGAAGKYALYSSTGGMNDAGHFTARATLNADFGKDEVSGTIDQFMGADGQSRDWMVELKKSTVSNTGGITGDPATDGNTDAQKTVWTIGGTAAPAAGQWSGDLKDTVVTATDPSGVPKVATGTFYSTYRNTGRMVGAFGAKKQ